MMSRAQKKKAKETEVGVDSRDPLKEKMNEYVEDEREGS